MLTSLFYFGHYRSFAARTSGILAADQQRAWPGNIFGHGQAEQKGRIIAAPQENSIMLNKAHNSKVLNYARNLSSSIVGLKDAAKMFVYDMHLIERNGTITFESHLQWVEEDLQNFINSYNNLQNVARGNNHSPELGHFAHYIRNFTAQNSQILSHLGIISYDNDSLTYHGAAHTTSHEAARRAVETFKGAYAAASDFLVHPLSHHMEFKGLNYYYNYTIGGISENTFRIIQSGMLIDVAV